MLPINKKSAITLTLCFLLSLSMIQGQSLTITCGGKKDRPAFDSSVFGGCFVTKNDITYEILGKPPLNISGSYGLMGMNTTHDCELHFNLQNKYEGEFKCGVIFLGLKNQSNRAIFSHFVFDKINTAPPNTPHETPELNLSTMNKTLEQLRSLQTHAENTKIINIITILVITTIGCIILIMISKKQKEKMQKSV